MICCYVRLDCSVLYILCHKIDKCCAHEIGNIREVCSGVNLTEVEARCKKDLRVRFGVYVEASRDSIIINDVTKRTHPCISLLRPFSQHAGITQMFQSFDQYGRYLPHFQIVPVQTQVH